MAETIKQEVQRMYAAGYRYATDCWIHSASGSDSRRIFYTRIAPSAELVCDYLKRKRSQILNDYVVCSMRPDGTLIVVGGPNTTSSK